MGGKVGGGGSQPPTMVPRVGDLALRGVGGKLPSVGDLIAKRQGGAMAATPLSTPRSQPVDAAWNIGGRPNDIRQGIPAGTPVQTPQGTYGWGGGARRATPMAQQPSDMFRRQLMAKALYGRS